MANQATNSKLTVAQRLERAKAAAGPGPVPQDRVEIASLQIAFNGGYKGAGEQLGPEVSQGQVLTVRIPNSAGEGTTRMTATLQLPDNQGYYTLGWLWQSPPEAITDVLASGYVNTGFGSLFNDGKEFLAIMDVTEPGDDQPQLVLVRY
jgi:hypothetical protein